MINHLDQCKCPACLTNQITISNNELNNFNNLNNMENKIIMIVLGLILTIIICIFIFKITTYLKNKYKERKNNE